MFYYICRLLNRKKVDGAMNDDGKRGKLDERAAVAEPAMRSVGGSLFEPFNAMIARQALAGSWGTVESDDDRQTKASVALVALRSVAPRNELEGMMAAQLVACHNAAMECFRRAALAEQGPQVRDANLAHAGRLSRAYAALVAALDRGEDGPKTVIVEHRVTRVESDLAPHAPQPNHANGNGHALNGRKAPSGTALR